MDECFTLRGNPETLKGALEIAAEKFEENARDMRAAGGVFLRVADQFIRQAAEARALYEQLA